MNLNRAETLLANFALSYGAAFAWCGSHGSRGLFLPNVIGRWGAAYILAELRREGWAPEN